MSSPDYIVFVDESGDHSLASIRRVGDGANRRRRTLLPLNIVIADKRTHSEGLQLADLTARPIGLHVLRPRQSNRAWDVIQTKRFRGARNCVSENGLKVFP